MRWLVYYPEDPDEKYSKDLSVYPLEKLIEMQNEIEDCIRELRANEPHAKRKYEDDHRIWFAQCQGYLADLRDVRDAIEKIKQK